MGTKYIYEIHMLMISTYLYTILSTGMKGLKKDAVLIINESYDEEECSVRQKRENQ